MNSGNYEHNSTSGLRHNYFKENDLEMQQNWKKQQTNKHSCEGHCD